MGGSWASGHNWRGFWQEDEKVAFSPPTQARETRLSQEHLARSDPKRTEGSRLSLAAALLDDF